MDIKELSDELAKSGNRKQDIRLRCLEIAAQMMGPQPGVAGETVQQYLDRFIPLSNVIQLHVTGWLPN